MWAQSERRQCQARCRGLVLAHNPRAADSMGVRRLQRALCSVEGPADASLYAIPGATPVPARHAHTSVAGHKERLGATYRETAPLYNPRARLSGQIGVSASFDLSAHANPKVFVCEALLKVCSAGLLLPTPVSLRSGLDRSLLSTKFSDAQMPPRSVACCCLLASATASHDA